MKNIIEFDSVLPSTTRWLSFSDRLKKSEAESIRETLRKSRDFL